MAPDPVLLLRFLPRRYTRLCGRTGHRERPELAHLRVRAHNPDYWATMAQAIPDYRLRRERLKKEGSRIAL